MKPATTLHNLAHWRALAALRVAKIAASAAALALWAAPAPAAACSCAASADLLWPAIDAADVSTRPDIVIYRVGTQGDTPLIDVELRGPDGKQVQLRERTAPDVRVADFCNTQLAFLESVEPLAANTKYEVSFHSRDPNAPWVSWMNPPRAFTTGAAISAAPPPSGLPSPPTLELHAYRLSSSTGICALNAYEACEELAQVDLGGPALSAGEPFWFRLSADLRDRIESLTIGVIPGQEGYAARAMVPIDPAAPCVTYERIDVRGSVVATGELCSFEKCVRYGRSTVRTGKHGCSGYNDLGAEVWDQISHDSCAAPPLIEADRNTGVISVKLGASDEVPDDAGTRDAATGVATWTPVPAASEPDAGASAAVTSQDTSPAATPAATADPAADRAKEGSAGCSLVPAPRGSGAAFYCVLVLALLACVRRGLRS